MSTYEEGYRDGMAHLSQQVDYLNDQLRRVSDLLNRAMFVQSACKFPKPGMNLWLILDGGVVTTGYYLNNTYTADSGAIVKPEFWCMIPPVIQGEEPHVRRILKVRKKRL